MSTASAAPAFGPNASSYSSHCRCSTSCSRLSASASARARRTPGRRRPGRPRPGRCGRGRSAVRSRRSNGSRSCRAQAASNRRCASCLSASASQPTWTATTRPARRPGVWAASSSIRSRSSARAFSAVGLPLARAVRRAPGIFGITVASAGGAMPKSSCVRHNVAYCIAPGQAIVQTSHQRLQRRLSGPVTRPQGHPLPFARQGGTVMPDPEASGPHAGPRRT